VTVVLLPEEPLFAAPFRLNGNGEMTGLEWVRESGLLTTPIGLTNTHSVGVVRDALVRVAVAREDAPDWSLPVVAETWDGFLRDINGFRVHDEHVLAAVEESSFVVTEGNVGGGGTGMICHGFKGGIGTASRVAEDGHIVGTCQERLRARARSSWSSRRTHRCCHMNALLAAETMTGHRGRTAYALDPEALVEVMKRYGRA